MATFEFKLPDIGEGVVEGEIVKWLVKAGDTVVEDQPLVEVMTDKATVTIPSPKAGKVVGTHGKEGESAKVHHVLVTLELGAGITATAADLAVHAPATSAAPAATKAATAAATNGEARVLATPVVRRMARELGVSLASVPGTGPQGRVTKVDLEAFQRGGATQAAPAPKGPALQPAAGDTRIPVRGLRKKIAENLRRSKQSAPHYHFVEEVDATRLLQVRDEINGRLARAGEKLSLLPFLVKATVAALKKNPRCNANMDEEKQELVLRGEYNLGIAVATDEGLVVPVIHGADRLSMREIAREVTRLSEAARGRRLTTADVSGGTFTITSLGAQGGLFATPIINHPEVAIMGVHKARKRPIVDEAGAVVVRDMMYLSWAFDHRNVDGAEGARFAYDLIPYVTSPELLLTELV